jgi:predicted metal-dependent peptidase
VTEIELLAKVTHARKTLLLDYPWFGTLALMLKVEISDKPKYAAHTDGTFIRFKPGYVEQASPTELVTLWAHEVMHCALQHPYRRGHRDQKEFNIAADYAINPVLKAAGMDIPANWLLDPQYEGMSAESIFAKRQGQKEQDQQSQPQQQPQNQQGKQKPAPGAGQPPQPQSGQPQSGAGQPGGQPSGDEGQPGEFGDAPPEAVESGQSAGQTAGQQPSQATDPNGQQPGKQGGQTGGQTAPPKMTAEDWKIATEQASRVCSKAGSDPGAAGRMAKATHEPNTDWRGELQEFIVQQQPSDYSWSSPNRRHIGSGLYLPGIHKENLGTIVWVTDSSGSIDDRALSLGWAEFAALVRECNPEKVLYYSCDTRCHLLGEYTPDEMPDTPPMHKGGGGTWFQPPFDEIAKRVNDGEEPPACLIYYSADLLNSDRPTEPEYPVLWIAPISCRKSGAFGKTIKLDAWG